MRQRMAPLRAVLLDDNADDRQHFRLLLCRHPTVALLGEATCFKEALELIERRRANVLFLESEVEGRSILDECRLVSPSIKLVFLTRHPLSAVGAFDLDAVDFLLKPLVPSRFGETIRRLLRTDWKRTAQPTPRVEREANPSMLIPFERGRRGASLNEIILIQAFGNYTRLTLARGQSEIVLRSLAKWGQLLPSPPFLRVHRNAIVHARKVIGLEDEAGGPALRIDGMKEKVPVSRRCLPEVRSMLFAVK